MKRAAIATLVAVVMQFGLNAAATAQTPGAASQPVAPPVTGIPVAVLDFDAASAGNPELGRQIAELLTAALSGLGEFTLVDRASLDRLLTEQELTLTGAVSTEQSIQIGKLVGAKVIITGKAFPLGDKMFVTAKLIGTETSLVEGVLVKGGAGGDIGDMMMDLVEKVSERLMTRGNKLVARDDITPDPLPQLKQRLAGKQLPTVAIVVTERHITPMPTRPIDPAVQTELKNMLLACGFKVVDVAEQDLAGWSAATSSGRGKPLPGVDLAIVGEAFSEYAARIGNLVSCAARTELRAVRPADGKTVFADKATLRAVDLAENIAGKTALQKTGRTLGIRLLEHLADTLPDKPKDTTADSQ